MESNKSRHARIEKTIHMRVWTESTAAVCKTKSLKSLTMEGKKRCLKTAIIYFHDLFLILSGSK
jgi:hypothetical protein